MKYNFKVSLKENDLYSFMMYHNYAGAQGKLGILVAILAFAAAAVTWGTVEIFYSIVYIGCGIIFLIYTPLSLKLKTKRQFAMVPAIKEEMNYELNDEKIISSMQDQKAEVRWIDVFKVVGRKDYIYIYTDRLHASIIPKAAMGDQLDDILEFITLKTPKGKVKIK